MYVYMYGYMLWVFALYAFNRDVKTGRAVCCFIHVCGSQTKKNRRI